MQKPTHRPKVPARGCVRWRLPGRSSFGGRVGERCYGRARGAGQHRHAGHRAGAGPRGRPVTGSTTAPSARRCTSTAAASTSTAGAVGAVGPANRGDPGRPARVRDRPAKRARDRVRQAVVEVRSTLSLGTSEQPVVLETSAARTSCTATAAPSCGSAAGSPRSRPGGAGLRRFRPRTAPVWVQAALIGCAGCSAGKALSCPVSIPAGHTACWPRWTITRSMSIAVPAPSRPVRGGAGWGLRCRSRAWTRSAPGRSPAPTRAAGLPVVACRAAGRLVDAGAPGRQHRRQRR